MWHIGVFVLILLVRKIFGIFQVVNNSSTPQTDIRTKTFDPFRQFNDAGSIRFEVVVNRISTAIASESQQNAMPLNGVIIVMIWAKY